MAEEADIAWAQYKDEAVLGVDSVEEEERRSMGSEGAHLGSILDYFELRGAE